MSEIINMLRDWGCDTDCIGGRFLGNEDFFLQMLQLGIADKNYPALQNAVCTGNVNDAFVYAHALKGTLGNLGITPAYELVSAMLEPLRHGDGSRMEADFRAFAEAFEKLKSIAGS
ncbi:MAG: Hpt domain-containing protein [Clostridia bacterium]|nr:Hpt domain-containing protein [Clostridia bacterium]